MADNLLRARNENAPLSNPLELINHRKDEGYSQSTMAEIHIVIIITIVVVVVLVVTNSSAMHTDYERKAPNANVYLDSTISLCSCESQFRAILIFVNAKHLSGAGGCLVDVSTPVKSS